MANKEIRQKERDKIESLVFDKKTLLLLSKIMKKGIITNLEYPISTGKEASVYLALSGEKRIAVKIYKKMTSKFKKKEKYISVDQRFKKVKKQSLDSVSLFAKKEFKMLEACIKNNVNVPTPIFNLKNIVVMEFCGKEGLPYPQLSKYVPRDITGFYQLLKKEIEKMKKAGIVHGDLSEYNILVKIDKDKETPIIIDFAQAVMLDEPNAKQLFERDIYNIKKFFKKLGVKEL